MRFRRPRSAFSLALAASLLVHLAAGVLVGAGALRARASAAETPAPDPDLIRLGVDRSSAVTLTWLGFEAPTPHQAPLSRVEQAALAIPGHVESEPGASPQPDPPTPAEPQPSQASEPSESAPLQTSGLRIEQESPQPLPWELATSDPTQAPARQLPPEQSAAQPAPPQQPTPQSSQPAPESAAGGTIQSGRPDDREAPATALQEPHKVEFGQPLAAEGLRIKTRVPASITIPRELLLGGRRPIFSVSFGHDGKVKRVTAIKPLGDPRVDEPIINALYAWTAEGDVLQSLPSGEALARLAPDDPTRWVTIPIEITRGNGR
ncbi:MAG: hypothetical protein H6811_06625 [Phycisphaeraceae bacterium]|nr:hypothetical protein [Phycisphaeraceae bacterium]